MSGTGLSVAEASPKRRTCSETRPSGANAVAHLHRLHVFGRVARSTPPLQVLVPRGVEVHCGFAAPPRSRGPWSSVDSGQQS